MWRNPKAVAVQRINECDERKNTRSMNARLKLANYCMDHTIFIASWLKDIDLWHNNPGARSSVILNGGDTSVYHDEGYKPWNGQEPVKLVTHHWGGNWMKGFDVYQKLDEFIGSQTEGPKVEFTYIGNLPQGFEFKHSHHVAPLSGEELATELRKHHIYLTASINEPAGMHHIEGALCGMPLLYRESGGLPEYCNNFGESFNGPDDFQGALDRMLANYDKWLQSLENYPHTAEKMAQIYCDTFEKLAANSANIAQDRKLWRSPLNLLLNQLPI